MLKHLMFFTKLIRSQIVIIQIYFHLDKKTVRFDNIKELSNQQFLMLELCIVSIG